MSDNKVKTVNLAETQVKKPTKQIPVYGVINRANYSITLTFKNGECTVLPPRGRTTKSYIDGDIVNVEGHPFAVARQKGFVTIYR